MTPPLFRSVTAKPLDITQPLATCVIGTRLRTLTMGLSAHERAGTAQIPSDKCAESSDSRRTARAVAASTTVTSEAGVDFNEGKLTMRFATKARWPSGLAVTA